MRRSLTKVCRGQPAAFSLIEILVSLAVTSVIMVLGFSVCHHTLEVWNGEKQLLEKNAEARVAFDKLVDDLQTITFRQDETEWFSLTHDTAIGPKGKAVVSKVPWLRFFATGPRTISYRLAFQDPIVKEGKYPVFGLYRFTGGLADYFGEDDVELAPQRVAENYWTKRQENLTEPGSLAAIHTVDFDVVVWYRVRGSLQAVPSGTAIQVIGARVETLPPVSGLVHVSQLEAIGVSLTSLSNEGATLLDAGTMDLKDLIRTYGQHFAARVEIHPASGGLP